MEPYLLLVREKLDHRIFVKYSKPFISSDLYVLYVFLRHYFQNFLLATCKFSCKTIYSKSISETDTSYNSFTLMSQQKRLA